MHRVLTQRLQPTLLHTSHRPAILCFTIIDQQRSNLSFLAWLRRAWKPSASTTTTTTNAKSKTIPNPATSDKSGLFSQAQASSHEAIIYPVYAYSTSIANIGNPIGDTLPDASELSLYRGPPDSSAGTSKTTETQTQTTMASDDDYAAFLEKANQPTSSSATTAQQTKKGKGFTTKSVDTKEPVPEVLQEVESVYVSEADEEFVPVSLGWSGKDGKIDVAAFAKLISQDKSGVTSLSTKEFDPRNQYAEVVDAVKKAGTTGQVEVFRVELEGARCEYWVVSVDEKGVRVVGLKVAAVES